MWGGRGQVGRAFKQLYTAAIKQAYQVGVCIQKALKESFSQGPHDTLHWASPLGA